MNAGAPIAQIPIGAWHGFVVLEPNTTVMEIKSGPYRPNEFAD
jgi:dTDP-4-dehydrorhamnose 3,5-epimerase-like enzyme